MTVRIDLWQVKPSYELQLETVPEFPAQSVRTIDSPKQCLKEPRPHVPASMITLISWLVAQNIYPTLGYKRTKSLMAELALDPTKPKDNPRFVVMPESPSQLENAFKYPVIVELPKESRPI